MGPPAGETPSQITRTDLSGGSIVRIVGTIDETFDHSGLTVGSVQALVLDLDGVRKITSFGIREWVKAIKLVPAGYVGYLRCRPGLLSQFNMISAFAGRGELLSFYAPYLCSFCEQTFEVLIDSRRQHAEISSLSLPPARCPRCSRDADLDDAPEVYLAYAARAPVPAPPALVDDLLARVGLGRGTLKVEKEVAGTVTAITLSGTLDGGARVKRLDEGLEGDVVVQMGRLSEADAAGLEWLRPLLTCPDASVYLSDVPLFTLEVLAREPALVGKAKPLSGLLPFTCSQCSGRTTVTVDRLALQVLADGKVLHRDCPRCGSPLSPDFSSAAAAAFLALGWADAPPPVREFLERETTRPSPKEELTGSPSSPGDSGPLLGRYHLVQLIGSGGMAEVFLARQTGVGGFVKEVVVKRILPHLASNEKLVVMFLQEARIVAQISHPNVVQIFDVGQAGKHYFIAMEYVRGWDLNRLLSMARSLSQPFTPAQAIWIVSEIASGLEAAHTCVDQSGQPTGFLHRDVSPHNVLVSRAGEVKLTDFGVAKSMMELEPTPSSVLKGKIAYMAPEQIQPGGQVADARADVFAAGIILYLCLTLEHPFKRGTEFETLRAIISYEPPPPSARARDISPELDELALAALARDPARRPPSARALRDGLQAVLRRMEVEPPSREQMAAFFADLEARAGSAPGRSGEKVKLPGDGGDDDATPVISPATPPTEKARGSGS
jgi:serine/threonine protein kinase